MLSGIRVSPILLTPDVHASWSTALREALEHLDDGARARGGAAPAPGRSCCSTRPYRRRRRPTARRTQLIAVVS
jgi:hypothetical protein